MEPHCKGGVSSSMWSCLGDKRSPRPRVLAPSWLLSTMNASILPKVASAVMLALCSCSSTAPRFTCDPLGNWAESGNARICGIITAEDDVAAPERSVASPSLTQSSSAAGSRACSARGQSGDVEWLDGERKPRPPAPGDRPRGQSWESWSILSRPRSLIPTDNARRTVLNSSCTLFQSWVLRWKSFSACCKERYSALRCAITSFISRRVFASLS
mmetsp:Transcript_43678/g.81167  ORF Transcript_43678/g.81167 Transcript_43678/m.81167 type:complete len:214 (+) Transcript_43678:915-1556(+)